MPFLLPPTPATEYICVKIEIPNTTQDIRNFLGQLLGLGQWFNYERTGNNLGSLVAQTWQESLENVLIGACMQVRQNDDEKCTLQYSNDGGTTWLDFADILQCVTPSFLEQSIIDAVNSSDIVREIISDSVAGLPDVAGNSSQYNQEVFSPPVGCDKDITWGYTKALWDFINQQNVDFLELLNEATNQYEQINTILKFVPGFEQLPISDVLDFVAQLGDYNLDAYNSSITVGLNDQIRCDLFCIAVNNGCTITFGDVYNYMLSKFGGLNAPTLGATFAELVLFMITGAYPNDRIVYLWSLVQLGFAFIGSEFLGHNGIGIYSIQAQIGDPDNDWSLLCLDCNHDWEHVFDFTVDDGGWSVLTWGDGWVSDKGWQSQDNNNVQEISYLEIFFPDTVFTFMELEHWTDGSQVDFGAGAGDTATAFKFSLNGVWNQVYYAINNNTAVSRTIIAYDNSVGLTADTLRLTMNPYLANPSKWYYRKITLRGKGVNPFV